MYPQTRSVNAELSEGMTDGAFKKVIRDRGGFPTDQMAERHFLHDVWYGIHEAPVKTRPDGLQVRTKNTVHTGPADLLG